MENINDLEKKVKESKQPRFDGGENYDLKQGVPNQYVEKCKGGAINLHIEHTGFYSKCNGCKEQETCKKNALVAGEQSGI